ncbi:MAG: N-acetylmuramoyl-L-alanine amidase [Eggerthellaceae bacterium]|nr:N-acetylmuramoyl-L-alanine amidase [Eggerthellaceae bacterium]
MERIPGMRSIMRSVIAGASAVSNGTHTRYPFHVAALLFAITLALGLAGCASQPASSSSAPESFEVSDEVTSSQAAKSARAELRLTEDYRDSFVHGDKPAEFQKYIVMHDTEGDGDAEGVINYWDGAGNGVAAHFVVNKDGSVVQCVPLDKIAHHAGYGDTGNNEKFGIAEDGRDDMVGTVPMGDWVSDYGMNAWSIGIEMVHVGGSGDYPAEQLEAVDALIAYIDAYYGFDSQIIDHKDWRTGNSDTSEEFAGYLANLKDHRTHD